MDIKTISNQGCSVNGTDLETTSREQDRREESNIEQNAVNIVKNEWRSERVLKLNKK